MEEDEEEEQVVYLEHGVSSTKDSLRSIHKSWTLTEEEYTSANRQKNIFRSAPSFRRKNDLSKATDGVTVARGSRSPEVSNTLAASDEEGDNGYLGLKDNSAVDSFNFANYVPNRTNRHASSTSCNHERLLASRSRSSEKSTRAGNLKFCDEEELDRPKHWGQKSKTSPRRRSRGSSETNASASSRKKTRYSHPMGTDNASSQLPTVSVPRPLSNARAAKVPMQPGGGGQNHRPEGLQKLSFRPSWLPIGGSRIINHDSKETVITSSNKNMSFIGPPQCDDLKGVSSSPELVDAIVTDHSVVPESVPATEVHTDCVNYSSDSELPSKLPKESAGKRKVKKSSDMDLLPKYLRFKRTQAEMEVRFQALCDHSQPQRHTRGDLQDPRSRTKRHIDVRVEAHSSALDDETTGEYKSKEDISSGKIVWEEHPFVVLSLKVDEIAHSNDRKSTESLVGQSLWGYFWPQTLSRMNISVEPGLRLRVYDYIILPPSTCAPDHHQDHHRHEVQHSSRNCDGMLVCTTLCESLL